MAVPAPLIADRTAACPAMRAPAATIGFATDPQGRQWVATLYGCAAVDVRCSVHVPAVRFALCGGEKRHPFEQHAVEFTRRSDGWLGPDAVPPFARDFIVEALVDAAEALRRLADPLLA